jgi:hypothetical protein
MHRSNHHAGICTMLLVATALAQACSGDDDTTTSQPSSGAAGDHAGSGDQDVRQDDAGVSDGGTAGTGGAVAGRGGVGGEAGHASAAAGSGGASGAGMATFTNIFAMFQSNCTGSTCHIGASSPGAMLSFTDKATAYMSLVNAKSLDCPGEKRVVPFQADRSILVHALEHTRLGTCALTIQMPLERAKLSPSEIERVTDWVNNGALDN